MKNKAREEEYARVRAALRAAYDAYNRVWEIYINFDTDEIDDED